MTNRWPIAPTTTNKVNSVPRFEDFKIPVKKDVWAEPWAIPYGMSADLDEMDPRTRDEKCLEEVKELIRAQDCKLIPMRTLTRYTFSRKVFATHPEGNKQALGIALKTLVTEGKLRLELGKRGGKVFRLLVEAKKL